MSAEEQRKLAAIMFTDMVGYSALNQRDEKLAQELLEEHRQLLREIFPRFHGAEIKTIGDAFLVEFNSALEAAQCAIEIQRALAKRNADAPVERQIEIRIGIHIGDVVHRGGDVYGDGVNIASRIEQLANAGGICVSMDVERQIRNALEARFEKLAPTELKNISVPMDLFRIALPWERPGTPVAKIQTQSKSTSLTFLPAAIVLLLIIGIGWWWSAQSRRRPASPTAPSAVAVTEKSIAVLPFENLSEEKANAFFTDGVQDEILTALSRIADLKVISRTSVMQYKSGAPRNLREIGQQLGVAHVVEGSVQRAANKVRVNAQLIDARNDAHLWAQTYDRDLADVFAIQSEIAKAIADQLQAKLSPNEEKAIEQPPTTDLAAFDLYSRAKSLLLTASFSATGGPDVRKAIELMDEAVKRDPSFFDAYCQLAGAHEQLYAVSGLDHTPARLALAEAALQAATRLRPDAGETHLARAQYLYYGRRDYAGALAELESARRALPNDPRLFELTGYILRRRGQQEEALRSLKRAVELDPRNFFTLQQIALSYQLLGRYAEAIAALDRALSIVPDNVETQASRGEFELCWKGDTRPLHQTIDSILGQGPSAIAPAADTWFQCALAERDSAAAERAIVAVGDNPCWAESAITLSRSFGEGLLARMTKDEARARTAFEAARAQQEKIVQAQSDYGPALCVLGMIDAGLGRKELALEEGRRAIALMPLEKDVTNGSCVIQYFAITAAWTGEKELALQQLETGLRAPTASVMLSYGALKLFPVWDPLRGDPRFEKIVQSQAPKEQTAK
ncbi:MAG TPA: adenylate/guanylate cyclase domain-containing protein [Chthoniobacterales bacterium]|jgi:TolB-like protein/class 3 adenylate cyclase/Tfp pilus assembly protein PilF|nr:adenylate/guanylate cyclase domain-containing protein [Chthoniobacterales bacterium]